MDNKKQLEKVQREIVDLEEKISKVDGEKRKLTIQLDELKLQEEFLIATIGASK